MARQEQIKNVDPLDALFNDLDAQLAEAATTKVKEIKRRSRNAPGWEKLLSKFEGLENTEAIAPKKMVGFVKAFFRKLGQEPRAEVKSLLTKMNGVSKMIEKSNEVITQIEKRLADAAARFDGGRGEITVQTLVAQADKYPAIKKAMELFAEEQRKAEAAQQLLTPIKEQIRGTLLPLVHDIRANESLREEMSAEELEQWEAIFGKLSFEKTVSAENVAEQEESFLLAKKTPATPDFGEYKKRLNPSYSPGLPEDANGADRVDQYIREKWEAKRTIEEVTRDLDSGKWGPVSAYDSEARKSFQDGGKKLTEFSPFVKQLCVMPTVHFPEMRDPYKLFQAQKNCFLEHSAYLEYETVLVAAREFIFERYLTQLKDILAQDLPGDDEATVAKREAIYQKFLQSKSPISVDNTVKSQRDVLGIKCEKNLFEGVSAEAKKRVLKLYLKKDLLEKLSEALAGFDPQGRGRQLRELYEQKVDGTFSLLNELDKEKLRSGLFEGGEYFYVGSYAGMTDSTGRLFANTDLMLKQESEEGVKGNMDFLNEVDALIQFVFPKVPPQLREIDRYDNSRENPLDINPIYAKGKVLIEGIQAESGRLPGDQTLYPEGMKADLVQLRAQRNQFVQGLSNVYKKLSGEIPTATRVDERKTAKRRVGIAENRVLTETKRAEALTRELADTRRLLAAMTTDRDAQVAEIDRLKTFLASEQQRLGSQVYTEQQYRDIARHEAFLANKKLQKVFEEIPRLQAAMASPGMMGGDLKKAVVSFLQESERIAKISG